MDLTFYLYTPSYQTDPVFLTENTVALLDRSYETKVIIHGFRSSAHAKWVLAAKNEYLQLGNYNIVTVDWSRYARDYTATRTKFDEVCSEIGEVLNSVIQSGYTTFDQMHVIGHSMGCHCGGYAARKVQHMNFGQKIGRLSCLDAARLGISLRQKVKKDDASLVDVIHTSFTLGLRSALGDVDFYPNGGRQQPGCSTRLGECSHRRAHEYWVESIRSWNFVAVKCEFEFFHSDKKCDSYVLAIMGEHLSKNPIMGSYYLETNDKPPFAKG